MTESDFVPDVFLCHNSKEKDAVRILNQVLRQVWGLNTYLDESTLVCGEEWELEIQRSLGRSKACAVIVGPLGLGEYQPEEVRAALKRREQEPSFRVIPVALPGANLDADPEFVELFNEKHRVTFHGAPDDPVTIRTIVYAVRGENAFPEGAPVLTVQRVRHDADRWDTGARRDDSLLYTGKVLRDASALVKEPAPSLVAEFLAASLRHHSDGLARRLGAHATVMWGNPRRHQLAAQLACESVRRLPTAEGVGVLRQAYAMLPSTVGTLTHPAPVTAAARSRLHSGLATGCADGSICLWDGSTLRVVHQHSAPVRCIADLGDGNFVSGAADGSCFVFGWSGGERLRAFRVGETVESLDVVGRDSSRIVLASGGFPGRPGEVVAWNATDGGEFWRMGMVTHGVLDSAGTHAVLAWGDHVALRRIADGQLAAKQPLNDTVISVAAHPTQPWVAATTFGRRAYLVSFESDTPEVRELGDGTSRVSPIRISPDGRYVAAVRDDFHVVTWDLKDGSRHLFKYEGLLGIDIHFSDESRYLAVVSPEAKAVSVWRVDDGEPVCTFEQDMASLAVFNDARNGLWIASDGPRATFVAMPRQSESLSTASPGIPVGLAYGPDGSLAWCGSPVSADLKGKLGDYVLWVADPLTGVVRLDTHLSETGRIAFDGDGGRIAIVGSQAVHVWDLTTGQPTATPESPFWRADETADEPAMMASLLMAPRVAEACVQRGRVDTLLSGGVRVAAIHHGNQLVSLWNVQLATEIVTFSTVAAVTRMAFNCDGSLFATGDERGGVMIWQTDGTSLGQVKHDEPIACLAFSPDGNFLAVASMDSMLRVWIASPTLLAAEVNAQVNAPLTDEDWRRYLGDEPRGASDA